MTAAEIATALGPARRSGWWWRCVCPIHGSRTGRSLTLALCDGDFGLVVHCHAGCSHIDILAELRRRGLMGSAGEHRPTSAAATRTGQDDNKTRRIQAARRIWNAAREARASPVAPYLAGRRITIPVPTSLRYAPAMRRLDGTEGPAIVSRVDDVDGQLIGIHRTWLYRDAGGIWRRRDRASLGPIGGGAVRLAPAAETLMIGEGLETCLSAMQATGMPAWAALSTSGMPALIPPPIVRTIIILADHDRSGAAERAAYVAADRWLAEGRRVRIALPPECGADFNDVLFGRAHARIKHARIKEVRDVPT
jgi:putative DNA primase/helicase